jgi:murein DD-endopeptidase MepM/ murein hydrolase activator NlpD
VAVLLAVAAMAASAAAGAWVQAQYSSSPAYLTQGQELVINAQVSRDSSYIRENVSVLASKVGDLQAKIIAMNGLSKRVAQIAGVSYTDPEVHASLDAAPVMDYVSSDLGDVGSAESLGRQLDILQQQVIEQRDWFAMLDLALTKRVGAEASLPTLQPVNYPYLSSSYGWRRHPITRRHTMHEGLDFAAPKGTPIYAASGGVVVESGFHSGYGNMVEINHGNGLVTRYAHASKLTAKVGDLVTKGQMIARVGSTGQSTGSHLHFEVRMAGHALNPTLFLAKPEKSDTLMVDATKHVDAILPEVR